MGAVRNRQRSLSTGQMAHRLIAWKVALREAGVSWTAVLSANVIFPNPATS